MPHFSRRQFLAAGSALAAGVFVYSRWGSRGSQQLRVAVIGAGGFGLQHIRQFMKRKDCILAYVCDADESLGRKRVQEVFQRSRQRPKYVKDLRTVFDDPTVDVVSIATPDHWHALAAIWAMQAGKDVYLEKPGSHDLEQIELVMLAAQKYKRICQIGLHQRSNKSLKKAIKYLHEGHLGEVNLARSLAYVRRKSIGKPGHYEPPRSVDYELWCGPAPRNPITRKRFHYDWHWFWDYGTGGIGNNGVHRVDIARWGLKLDGVGDSTLSFGGRFGGEDAGETPNTHIAFHQFGPKTIVQEVRGLPTEPYLNCKNGVIFQGTAGYLICEKRRSTHFDDKGQVVKKFEEKPTFLKDHFNNFLDCVRNRNLQKLAGSLERVGDSARLCHLANLSYRQGEELEAAAIPSRAGQLAPEVIESTLKHIAAHARAGERPIWGKSMTADAVIPQQNVSAGDFKIPAPKEI